VKRFVTLAALSAIALVSSGCNTNGWPSSSYAARVGHGVITTAQLTASMREIEGDKGFVCLSQSGSLVRVTGSGSDTYAMQYADTVLQDLIEFGITTQMFDSDHLSASPWAYAQAKQQIEERWTTSLAGILGNQHANCGSASSILDKMGPVFAKATIDSQVQQDAIAARLAGTSLDPVGISRFVAKYPAAAIDSCVSVIEVATRASALKIRKAIEGGAKFATEATKYSTAQGVGAGGAVGCSPGEEWAANLGKYINPLATGALSQPVAFSGNYLLITVTSRKTVPAADLISELASVVSAEFNKVSTLALLHTSVAIDPAYGSWKVTGSVTSATVSVQPPPGAAAAAAAAPNKNAVTPSTIATASFTP
jgi:hypothetical protein